MSAIERTVARVQVTESRQYDATVDVDAVIEAFPDEWAEWMRGEEPSNDDKTDFLKETIHEMGADFFDRGSSPWLKACRDDDDFAVDVTP